MLYNIIIYTSELCNPQRGSDIRELTNNIYIKK